jgi:hypothetical protein
MFGFGRASKPEDLDRIPDKATSPNGDPLVITTGKIGEVVVSGGDPNQRQYLYTCDICGLAIWVWKDTPVLHGHYD